MKIRSLHAERYRGLRDASVELDDLNVFIGANAVGKSALLDAFRFLGEGVRARDFDRPVFARGGIVHLAWKGEEAQRVRLVVRLKDGDKTYEWSVRLFRDGYDFGIEERVDMAAPHSPPVQLLASDNGEGWWRSGEKGEKVTLKQGRASCALAAAAADASFPAREVAAFIGRWGFFDPNPFLLRRDWTGLDSARFDPYGRNLGETLYSLDESSRDRVVEATRAIVGLPDRIEPRKSQDEERFYFVQSEPGLQYPVHQMGASGGTLRMLALMTALLTESEKNLIGVEEPENYIHPAALASFVEHLREARNRIQIMVTTHSPLLLDYLNEPEAVRVVRRGDDGGATVVADNAEGVRRALEESGFGLGAYYETKGFGAD